MPWEAWSGRAYFHRLCRFRESDVHNLLEALAKDPRISAEFKIQYIDWSPKPATVEKQHESAQSGDYVEHMHIIRDTDIHISGGGTGQMYQTFLPDNAVHIGVSTLMSNGENDFMEEYMAEGTPHLRSLFFRNNKDRTAP